VLGAICCVYGRYLMDVYFCSIRVLRFSWWCIWYFLMLLLDYVASGFILSRLWFLF